MQVECALDLLTGLICDLEAARLQDKLFESVLGVLYSHTMYAQLERLLVERLEPVLSADSSRQAQLAEHREQVGNTS